MRWARSIPKSVSLSQESPQWLSKYASRAEKATRAGDKQARQTAYKRCVELLAEPNLPYDDRGALESALLEAAEKHEVPMVVWAMMRMRPIVFKAVLVLDPERE